ncbi:MAG: hypothetical protein ACK519_03250 [Sphingomonadaceae bacterium]
MTPPFVILNLFQYNMRPLFVILKQVQDDEGRGSGSRGGVADGEGAFRVGHQPTAPALKASDGPVEHVDAFNSAGRNAPSQFGKGDVLSRGPRAIDQNIAGRSVGGGLRSCCEQP